MDSRIIRNWQEYLDEVRKVTVNPQSTFEARSIPEAVAPIIAALLLLTEYTIKKP